MVSWSRRGWKVEIRGHLTFRGSVIFRYPGSEIGQKQSRKKNLKKWFSVSCFETDSRFLCQALAWIGDQSRRTALILCNQIVVKIRKRKFHYFFLSESDFLVTHLSPDCGIFSRVRCKAGRRIMRDVAPKSWPFEFWSSQEFGLSEINDYEEIGHIFR